MEGYNEDEVDYYLESMKELEDNTHSDGAKSTGQDLASWKEETATVLVHKCQNLIRKFEDTISKEKIQEIKDYLN